MAAGDVFTNAGAGFCSIKSSVYQGTLTGPGKIDRTNYTLTFTSAAGSGQSNIVSLNPPYQSGDTNGLYVPTYVQLGGTGPTTLIFTSILAGSFTFTDTSTTGNNHFQFMLTQV